MINWKQLEKAYQDRPKSYEFGYCVDRNVFAHREPDGWAIAYFGERIAEKKDSADDLLFTIPDGGMSAAVSKRYANLLPGTTDVFSKKLKRANGLNEVQLTIQTREYDSALRAYKTVCKTTVTAASRFRVIFDATEKSKYSVVAEDNVVDVSKDNVKYRDFNAKLKKLKAVLVAQLKMGAYNDLLTDKGYWDRTSPINSTAYGLADKDIMATYLSDKDAQAIAYKLCSDWVDKNNVTQLRNIVAVLAYGRSSNEKRGSLEDLKRRVLNGLRDVQVAFLRKECITISEPPNSLRELNESSSGSDDQDRLVQPHDGLREVQVPSKAEVC